MFQWCRDEIVCMRRTAQQILPPFTAGRRNISSDGNRAHTRNRSRGSQSRCGRTFSVRAAPPARKTAGVDLTTVGLTTMDRTIADLRVTTMFLDPATPIRMLETVPHSADRIMLPVRTLRCKPTMAQKMLVARRQIQAGGLLALTLQMERTVLPEQMFPAARMLLSTVRRARGIVARSGTITFLVPRTAVLRRTPIAEVGSDSRRNLALPVCRSRPGVHWTTDPTVPITTAHMATAPTATAPTAADLMVEVIRGLKAHTPADPDTRASRADIHGLR